MVMKADEAPFTDTLYSKGILVNTNVDGEPVVDHVTVMTPFLEKLQVGGVKNDQGKEPWDLLPWDAIRGIVKVLAFGAQKYEKHNWLKGMDWSRLFASSQRHLTAWWEGEDKDPETGYSHLWHALCGIMFLATYEIRGLGKDDRYKV